MTMDERFFPEVLQVVPGAHYSLYAYFNDGTVRLYDAGALVARGGVFHPLADKAVFDAALTVMNGTAAWDLDGTRDPRKCIDIDPFDVYDAPIVRDPLEV
jgi:hypothetical protein